MNRPTSFRSYAQNQEDVVLWRALGHIEEGHYVEVGAYHPTIKSISFAFYEHGWSGILIEPQKEYCELTQLIRPRDNIVQSAVGSEAVSSTPFYRVPGGARSTMQSALAEKYGDYLIDEVPCTTLTDILSRQPWAVEHFHFLVLDVEGSETVALQGLDLSRFRPWVLVVESIDPLTKADVSLSWKNLILQANYEFSHFDGVSQFFVAHEHRELLPHLHPACCTDDYVVDFPRLPSGFGQSYNVNEHSLAMAVKALLAELTEMTGVSEDNNPVETIAGRVIELLESGKAETIDQIEQIAALLQVVSSRARIHHAIKKGGRRSQNQNRPRMAGDQPSGR